MTRLQRAAGVAVGLLVLAGVLALSVRGIQAPAKPMTGTGADTPASACINSSSSNESPDAAAAALLASYQEIQAEVAEIRGLPGPDVGPPVIIARDQLEAEIIRFLDARYPAVDRYHDTLTLQLLGLLDSPDHVVFQVELMRDYLAGYYDYVGNCIVVVNDGVAAALKMTYAHEYAHAMQDAAFDLESLELTTGVNDRSLARQALVEGDATHTMYEWALGGGLTREELQELASMPMPENAAVPSQWMARTGEFAYGTGLAWVQRLAGAGDYAAIDDALRHPPDSTEQVLHAGAWDAREQPAPVTVPDLSLLGEQWTRVVSTSIGEMWIAIILEYHGVPRGEADAAAAGWRGDHMVMLTDPDDSLVLAWVLEWDTPADAEEFVRSYGRVVARSVFPGRFVWDDDRVLLVHAVSESVREEVIRLVAQAGH